MTVSFLREQKSDAVPFSGSVIINPYQNSDFISHTKKSALHLHSDSVWYTPERHTKAEIKDVYQKNGYSLLGITDYDKFGDEENGFISGYEWGRNLRKRHALGIGGKKIVSDYFPIYARRENVNWTFKQMQKNGSYVVVSHPKLNDSFTKEDLINIQNYNAIEVFSPFGDDTKILDTLLTSGRNVHCMSTDDLHYFAEETIQKFEQPIWKDLLQKVLFQRGRKGESLKRYVTTASEKINGSDYQKALFDGAFYCVRKHFREAEDPLLPNIKLNKQNQIQLTSNERYMEIRWIGKGGEFRQIDSSTNEAVFQMSENDPYIRLEIITLSGVIISNAIYRQN